MLLRILALPLKALKERVSSRKYSIMLQNFFRFRPPPLSKSKPEGSNYRLLVFRTEEAGLFLRSS